MKFSTPFCTSYIFLPRLPSNTWLFRIFQLSSDVFVVAVAPLYVAQLRLSPGFPAIVYAYHPSSKPKTLKFLDCL